MPRFEWYVVKCGSQYYHPKEIGLRAQNMLIVLASILKMIEGTTQ